MLKKLRIKNFKAWKDTGDIRLAPFTVLFGPNSAGKSSLGHLLLTLKQTVASADRKRALHTSDESSLIDLGTFVDVLHGRDRTAELEFTLGWSLPEPLEVQDPLDEAQRFSGDALSLSSVLAASATEQPVIRRLRYELLRAGAAVLDATLTQSPEGEVRLSAHPYRLIEAEGRTWPLEAPEKFYRLSARTLARYKNADFLADFALATEQVLTGLSYLGPLREPPQRTYGWSGSAPEDVGPRGQYAISCIVAADAAGRKLSRGRGHALQPFAELIASWLVDLGVIESFEVQPTSAGRKDYEVRVKTLGGLTEVALPDVGFGVSQVLPALVEAFYCPEGSTVWMEQPELHLHPRVQAELVDVFLSAIAACEDGEPRNVQLVIETHSEHFLNRLQRRVAEEVIAPRDIAIYFVRPRSEGGAELEELVVNEYGDITNWPEDFFGDEMGDIVARSEAAAARRTGGGER